MFFKLKASAARIAAPAATEPLVSDAEVDAPEKFRHRVAHDLSDIENRSLEFDRYIPLRTPFALLWTENAY